MNQKAPTRVLIIDDHPLFRQGIVALIGSQKDFVVCGEVSDSKQAITAVQKTNPELVLLDIALNGASGIEVLKDLKVQFPKIKVLMLSMHDETIYAPRALRAGALGYITKAEAAEKVLDALRQILKGDVYLSPGMETKMLNTFTGKQDGLGSPIDLLSDRELEVYTLLGNGNGSREVAEQLHLSIKTIESHRAHIKEKLQLKNAAELLRHAIEWTSSEALSQSNSVSEENNKNAAKI